MKLSIKDIDRILESTLNNLTNVSIQNQNGENDSQAVDSLTEPIVSYLDSEEKSEKNKIQDFNRIKSVITDPNEKKIKDNAIKNSQQKLNQINQTRSTLMSKQEELKKQTIISQQNLQKQMAQLKQNAEMLNKLKTQVQESYDKNFSLPILKRAQLPNLDMDINEQIPIAPTNPVNNTPQEHPLQKKPAFKVKFEGNSQNPFEVYFSERGFKIGTTRLSFETVEDALSKNFTITLDNGAGLVLDAVRMQKILKYKSRT